MAVGGREQLKHIDDKQPGTLAPRFLLKGALAKIPFFLLQDWFYRDMRSQLNKLVKKKSTKSERKFAELLKELHISFRTKIKIQGHEIDFLIRNYAIEIDSHKQNPYKNRMLIENGFNPIHLNSWEIGNHLKNWLLKICQ